MSRALLLIALGVAAVPTLSAQVVRGTVLDSATVHPLPAATIELVAADAMVADRATSDSAGSFEVRARAPGRFQLRVRRVGYGTVATEWMALGARADTTLRLMVAAAAVTVRPVTVTAPAAHPYLAARGFYQRREGGAGVFLDPPALAKRVPKARFAVDLMEGIPGVRLQIPSNSAGIRVPYLRSCRSDPRRRVPLSMGGSVVGLQDTSELGNVYPNIYLDGIFVGQDVFGWLLPAHVLAIEIYMGPAQIPLQYGGTGAPCGVILIWTEH